MKIEEIKDSYSIGTKVSIGMVSGREFYGTLVEIRESIVQLRLPDDKEISINAASIGYILEEEPGKDDTPSPPVPDPIPPVPTPSPSIEVTTKVEEINARFKATILEAKLDVLPPNFSLPSNVVSSLNKKSKKRLQGEWNKLKNQYDHAKRNNQLQRLDSIISGYEKIINSYPELSSAARFNIGCLYLEMNQFDEAKEVFELEASDSPIPEGFYNLAIYVLGKEEIDYAQCLPLFQKFFEETLLVNNELAWYTCLRLSLGLGKIDLLLNLLKKKVNSPDMKLILDSFVFFLKANQYDDYANKLTQIIMENSQDFKIVLKETELMISQLDFKPAEEYLKVVLELYEHNDKPELAAPAPAPKSSFPEPPETLSSFLKFHLENCDYVGVEAAKKQSKTFTEKDVEQLIMYADKVLGTKRLGERASYYLSAAKVLIDLGSQAEEKRPRIHLRNFCSLMGDACIAEKQDDDIVRSYYAEAFLIAPQWVSQLDLKLSQYIMLYYSSPDELLKPKLPPMESCLKEALSIQNVGKLVIEGLLYLSWLNREIGDVLSNRIYLDKNLLELVQSLCYEILGEQSQLITNKNDFVKLWKRGRGLMGRQHQEIVDELAFLHSLANSLDNLPEQTKRIQELRQKFRLELDKKRLDKIKNIVTEMYDYSRKQLYTEQERDETIINNNITQLTKEIEQSPTQYSWEFLFPYLNSLKTTINQHFQKIQQAAEPESLKTQSSTNLPNTEYLECQITISNESGNSPASGIKIEVLESPTQEYEPQEKFISITEALPGGQSITCQIPVKITEIAQEAKVFILYYKLSYSTRAKNQITTEQQEPIQLYSVTDFQEINNPYGSYAQGNIVRDEKMFYGRDKFIDNLISSIRNAPSAKSFVIYGQKRTGKSSILYHLQQNLNLPIIPVSFSIGGLDLSDATFLYKIIREIEEAFEVLAEQGYPTIDVQRPELEKMQDNPQIRFEDYISELRKNLRKIDEYRNAKIMLLIDEFSYIYREIQRGNVQSSFMQFWKALLEKNYFGAVLVGQDYMPRFIDKFPNDFQIAENKRIAYLEKEDERYARNLIINPILTEKGESRYKGGAVNKLIVLTAGSPFYIQIFCNRLVNYMNRKKIMYVTDADIERVKEELITGNNSLDSAAFDNLTSAGDDYTDDISKEDTELVLRDIAKGTKLQPYCDRSSITTETSSSVDEILKDLETREVIEKQGASGYRIKVGLFKEWLLAHQ